MAHEWQCGHVRQEMGICKLELFKLSYVYACMYMCMYNIWHFTSRAGRELDISPILGWGGD